MRKTLKFIFSLIFLLLCGINLFALSGTSENSLLVSAMIPEDSGVEFPSNVIHIDRMYFSIDGTEESLLTNEQLDAGTINIGMNEFRISLLYYGNQAKDYKVVLKADAGDGWSDRNGNIIPIVTYIEDSNVTDDISVTESDIGSADVVVPAAGPRRGEASADIVLEWSGDSDLEPGIYTVGLDIYMYSV